jgi:hypothetical protein
MKKRRLLHVSGCSLILAILSACGGSASTGPAPGDAAEDLAASDPPGSSAEPSQLDVDASLWRVSETASTTSSVAQLAIMVDADGTPHIAHNGGIGTSGGLRHAWLVNGELTEEVIDDNSRGWQKSWVAGAPEPRLVYDSNHLFEPVSFEASRDPSGAWTVGTFSFLHHVAASSGVWRDSGSWVVRQAAERRDAYFQGQPAVAVLHGVLFDVQLAATGGMHYGREEVTPGLALALDRSGKAHVIYSAPSDELADFPNSASLAGAADVDKRSELVMYTVRYLTLGDSGWSEPETLTPSEGWYHGLSMAIDDQDNVHVAFSGASEFVPSDSEYDLRFASTITHLQRAPDSAWVREDVSTSGSPQLARGSLALSPNGDPELVYYSRPSAERGEVTYARKQGSTWTTELIQAGCARHGAEATLALDAAGNPHVAYRSCEGKLVYATRPAP